MRVTVYAILIAMLAPFMWGCGGGDEGIPEFCQVYCANMEACEREAGNGFQVKYCEADCASTMSATETKRNAAWLNAYEVCLAQEGCNTSSTCTQTALDVAFPNRSTDNDFADCMDLDGTCSAYIEAFDDHCHTMFTLNANRVDVPVCVAGEGMTADGCYGKGSAVIVQCVADKTAGLRADDCPEKRSEAIKDCIDNTAGEKAYDIRVCVEESGGTKTEAACLAELCNLEVDGPVPPGDKFLKKCRNDDCIAEETDKVNARLIPCLETSPLVDCLAAEPDPEIHLCLCEYSLYCMTTLGTFSYGTL